MMSQLPSDLVLLDISLPGMDGLEVCRQIRRQSRAPIIMVTSIDSPEIKLKALELGADDYMTKPFRVGELLARIQAALEWSQKRAEQAPSEIRVDDLTIDLAKRQVRRGEEQLSLTEIEFDLLKALVTSPDRLLTSRHLLEAIQGPECEDVRALHVHICNLRSKIETYGPGKIRRILSVPGVGYRFRLME